MPADVPPATVPKGPVTEIASYAGTTMWLEERDGKPVVLLRARGAGTRLVDVAPKLRDLDLGPGPDGRPTAVYVRCPGTCDAFRLDLRTLRETKLPTASRHGVSERLPTIWRTRIAFQRSGRTWISGLSGGRPRAVDKGTVDDLELGPDGLAYSAEFDSDEANGETGLVVLDPESENCS